MIKVSVIIPIYNAATYLGECLDSVLKQTIKEFEVICIDDGSADGSRHILNAYSKNHSNITVVTQQKAGSGKARNVGINMAKGEYLMFVDADDFLMAENILEILYENAQEHQVAVCGGSMVLYENGVFSKDYPESRKGSIVDESRMLNFQEYQYPYAHTRYVIKRELLLNKKIYYPDYQRGQDAPFMAKVLNAADHFYLVKEDVYGHRLGHKKEVFTAKKADDFVQSFCDLMELAMENHYQKLFESTVNEIIIFARKQWYQIVDENKTWDKIDQVKKRIQMGNEIFQCGKQTPGLLDENQYDYLVKRERESIRKAVQENEKVAIYGAGMVGKQLCAYLAEIGYVPSCFVVTAIEQNEKEIDGLEVIRLDDLRDANDYLFILSVLNPEVKEEMKKCLSEKGCEKILDFDADSLNYGN